MSLSALGLLTVIIRAAWLCDDAYITLRTVDNAVNGYGLRWNIAERVQSYTHPLWLLAMLPVYWGTGSARVTLFALSLAAVAVTLVLAGRVGRTRPLGLAIIFVALATSKAFVEYSTSGLEVPLLYLLLAALYALDSSQTAGPESRAVTAVLLTSLVLLTRMDAVLLLAPLVSCMIWRGLRREAWLLWTSATVPFIAWELFSILYYGFPFPNTAYAKLGHGVPRMELVTQGLAYLANAVRMDPVGAALVGVGLATATAPGAWSVPAGVALWIGYLIWIGGDFMTGRMLAPAILLCALQALRYLPPVRRGVIWVPATVVCCVLAMLSPSPAIWGPPAAPGDGRTSARVTDERLFYYPTTGLLRTGLSDQARHHPWAQRAMSAANSGVRVFPLKSVGFGGFFAGPRLHIVDEYALTDALLARLPAEPDWSPGHFHRVIPPGYIETLERGVTVIADSSLAQYYDTLELVIRGKLLDRNRLHAVLRMNLEPQAPSTHYDIIEMPASAVAPVQPGTRKPVRLPGQGLRLKFPKAREVAGVELVVEGDDDYLITYERDGLELRVDAVEGDPGPTPDSRVTRVVLLDRPLVADAIRVRGRRGDFQYSVESVRLLVR